MSTTGLDTVLVGCPDARPPAYQAVVGLAKASKLDAFLTSYYDRHQGNGIGERLARRIAPKAAHQIRKALGRRFDPEIPADSVMSVSSYDLAIRLENRVGGRIKRAVANWRTEHFDQALARTIERRRPSSVLVFSDVGSKVSLPLCRDLGIPTILSMVHGDVREENEVLDREAERSPEFFCLYLGNGALDLDDLDRLHDRRLRDLEYADRVLVPSEHIARQLIKHGTPSEKIGIVPYAADSRRFVPPADKVHRDDCTFLFAGGISQRKGIRYLLEAWKQVKRPNWRLQLVGALPRDPGPLTALFDGVELVGRVSHSEMPALMARADVFVFPSLFEGSAVVTYEALASGLPSIVTPSAGSVARDGIEGLVVPAGEIEPLAESIEKLGSSALLRAAMSHAARARALDFDWPRYHEAIVLEIDGVGKLSEGSIPRPHRLRADLQERMVNA